MPACEKTGSCHCLLCALSTFQNHITLRLHKRGVYSELGGETESLLTPEFVKLSHNGASDAQVCGCRLGEIVRVMLRREFQNFQKFSQGVKT